MMKETANKQKPDRNANRRSWNKDKVAKELLELHRNGCVMKETVIKSDDAGLASATRRYFGSWKDAMEELGIPLCYKTPAKWSRKKVEDELIAMVKRGESIRAGKVRKEQPELYSAVCKYCGGMNAAAEALGIDYSRHGRRRLWKKMEVLYAVRTHVMSGKRFNPGWVRKHDNSLYTAARKKFGSWEEALKLAGVDNVELRPGDSLTEEQIIETVRSMYAKGERLDATFVLRVHRKFYRKAAYRFGNWKNCIKAAGIDYENVSLSKR